MDVYRDVPKNVNKTLRLTLPLPPSVNHMHIMKRNGSRILTKTAQNYIKQAKALINLAIDEQKWLKQEYAVWMYMDAVVYMPDRRIRDSHNLLKLLIDVMQGEVFSNDYYLMPRIQGVEFDAEYPRIEIRISTQSERDREKAVKITT